MLEDADPALQPLACPDVRGPAEQMANRLRTQIRTLMVERGADLAYGRTLPRNLGHQLAVCRNLALRREWHLNACTLADYGLGMGDDWRTVTDEKLRSQILMAEPDVVEETKWRKASNPEGVPTFSCAGLVCTLETYNAEPDPDRPLGPGDGLGLYQFLHAVLPHDPGVHPLWDGGGGISPSSDGSPPCAPGPP